MKICTITNQNEILTTTLRNADYIDAITPSIPTNSIIVDSNLPAVTKNQALKIKGKRNADGYYTTINNLEIVADYRGSKAYSTNDGSELSINELGELPSNVTLTPRPSEYHSFVKNKWALTQDGVHRKKTDEAKAHNQKIYAQIESLELKQNRPLREERLAIKTGDEQAAKAALDRIKAIDEQIQQLRTTLKTTSKE